MVTQNRCAIALLVLLLCACNIFLVHGQQAGGINNIFTFNNVYGYFGVGNNLNFNGNNIVFSLFNSTSVYEVDGTTGDLIGNWTAPSPIGTNSVVDSTGTIYFACLDMHVYAYRLSSWTQLWSYSFAPSGVSFVPGKVQVVGANVYFSDYLGNVTSVVAATGALRWVAPFSMCYSGVAVLNGATVFACDQQGIIGVSDATGSPLMTVPSTLALFRSTPVASSSTGLVYLTTEAFNNISGSVIAVNPATNALVWNYTNGTSFLASPLIVDGVLYVGDQDYAYFWALDATTGSFIWNTYIGSSFAAASWISQQKLIVVPTVNSQPQLFDQNGNSVGSQNTFGYTNVNVPMLVNGNTVYLASDYQVLAAYTLPTFDQCPTSWEFNGVNGPFYRAQLVDESLVFVVQSPPQVLAVSTTTGQTTINWTNLLSSNVLDAVEDSATQSMYVTGYDENTYEYALYSYNLASGALKWNVSTEYNPGKISVAGSAVYVGNTQGNVFSFDVTTGAQRWNYSLPDTDCPHAVLVVNGIAIFSCTAADGVVGVVDATGQVAWTVDASPGCSYEECCFSSPVLGPNGNVFIGMGNESYIDSMLSIVPSTGTVSWSYTTSVVGSKNVVNPKKSNKVVAKSRLMKQQQQQQQATLQAGGWSNFLRPAFLNGVVYTAMATTLLALDISTGAQMWNTSCSIAGYPVSPVIFQDQVVWGTSEGNVFELDPSTGLTQGLCTTDFGSINSLLTDGNLLYVVTTDSVYAITI